MSKSQHNIICLEAEWQFRNDKRNTFCLNTEPLLHWLKEFHDCNVIYRHIVTKEDLVYYLHYFSTHKRETKDYDIVYIACHGWHHAISLEGKEGFIDLSELAEMSNGLFNNRIVHFGSCKTMANIPEAENFKAITGAKLVSGYQISVDPMTSAIADAAYFNEIMQYQNLGTLKNKDFSKFWSRYESLLNELKFSIV